MTTAKRPSPRGQVLAAGLIFLFLLLATVVGTQGVNNAVFRAEKSVSDARIANAIAEAGMKKAFWCLNAQSANSDCGTSGSSYPGETSTAFGGGVFTSTVTTVDQFTKSVDVVAVLPNTTTPRARQHLQATAVLDTSVVAFNYALQTGVGGITIGSNASVAGNVYANGNVSGSNGAVVTGDVWVAGGTQPTTNQQWLTQNASQNVGQDSVVVDVAQSFTPSATNVINSVSLFLKKVGAPGNKTVLLVTDSSGKPSKTSIAQATIDTSLIGTSFGWISLPFQTPVAVTSGTPYWIVIDSSTSATNYLVWGNDLQAGYANGQAKSSASWNAKTPTWNAIIGDLAFEVWMGGIATALGNLSVGGEAHANTISGSSIGTDAYYQIISGTTVNGTSHPNTADPGPAALPISNSAIAEWKADAAIGGTIVGDFHPTGGSVTTLGPKEITGNLILDNNQTLVLSGAIYVHGNITMSNNVLVQLPSSYGSASGIILADGTISFDNNATVQTAIPGTYVLVIALSSANTLAAPAMELSNNVSGAIFYAPNGKVVVDNNVHLTGVVGDSITLNNNAVLTYDIGLADAHFASGPGGSWALQKGSWREIK